MGAKKPKFLRGWLPTGRSLSNLKRAGYPIRQGLIIAAIGLAIPEMVTWTLFLIGLYKDSSVFLTSQAVIFAIDAFAIVLAYRLAKPFERKASDAAAHDCSGFPKRGWLPNNPSFPSITAQGNQKTSHYSRIIVYTTIFVSVFSAVFLTMSAAYGLGLGNVGATFAAATTGVMTSIVANILLKKPDQNKPLTAEGKKAAKIFAGANASMVGVFLGTYFLVNPNIKSAELTLGLWIVLLATMFAVNNLLYRRFKKQIGLAEGV